MSKPDISAETGSDFKELFRNAPCGYLTMQPGGRILQANATLAAWIGQTEDELVGKRFQDLLTFGTRLFYETSLAPQLVMGGTCDEMSMDLRTTSGASVAVSASGRVSRDETGRLTLVRLAFFKAAERRRYERQLVAAQNEIKEQKRRIEVLLTDEVATSQLREQFIAILGHDLRNPLASLASGLEILQNADADQYKELVFSTLEGSISRMTALIDDILDFARGRLGAGISLETTAPTMMAPFLEQTVAELRISHAFNAIETSFILPFAVQCDPHRIGQLVSNLLGNALTHGAANTPVRVQAEQSEGMLIICVSNQGMPIPPDDLQRLFQPFFRGEVRGSRQGLGLGLYIAAEIARAHGGVLEVSSTADETRFTFQMPMLRGDGPPVGP